MISVIASGFRSHGMSASLRLLYDADSMEAAHGLRSTKYLGGVQSQLLIGLTAGGASTLQVARKSTRLKPAALQLWQPHAFLNITPVNHS